MKGLYSSQSSFILCPVKSRMREKDKGKIAFLPEYLNMLSIQNRADNELPQNMYLKFCLKFYHQRARSLDVFRPSHIGERHFSLGFHSFDFSMFYCHLFRILKVFEFVSQFYQYSVMSRPQ